MESAPELVAGIIDDIRRIFKVVNEYSKTAERETGLTGPQLWAVKTIAAAEQIKPSELARKMYLHPATVVGLIDRLENRGLVSRTRQRKDRRVVEIALTKQGEALLDLAPDVPQGELIKGLEILSKDKLLMVSEGLTELVKILGIEGAPPQLLHSPEVNMPSD